MISPITKKISDDLYVHKGMQIQLTTKGDDPKWVVSLKVGPGVTASSLDRAKAIAEKRASSSTFELAATDLQVEASEREGAIVWGGVTSGSLELVLEDLAATRLEVLHHICPSLRSLDQISAQGHAVHRKLSEISVDDYAMILNGEQNLTYESVWYSTTDEPGQVFAKLDFLPWGEPWVFYIDPEHQKPTLIRQNGEFYFEKVAGMIDVAEAGATPASSTILQLHPTELRDGNSLHLLKKKIHQSLSNDGFDSMAQQFWDEVNKDDNSTTTPDITNLQDTLNVAANYIRFF